MNGFGKDMLRVIARFVFTLACLLALRLVAAAQQGGTTRYIYDDNGRLRAVVSPTGEANVYEYDPAGNFTAIRRLAMDTVEVLDFSPREGVPGERVTLIGTGFGTSGNTVSFNRTAARVVQENPPIVIAEVPLGATTGPISITTPRGSANTSAPFTIRGIRVSPSSAALVSGETIQFTAAVTQEGDQSVRWSVNGTEGGSPSVGTISATGLYTAPNLPSNLSTFISLVRATSNAVPSLSGEAQVRVRNIGFVRPVFAGAVSVRRESLTTTLTPIAAAISVRYAAAPSSAAIVGTGASVTKGPNISSISPNRLSRGATVTVTFNGANLSGANSIQFINDNGAADTSVTASNLSVNPDGTSVNATVTVDGGTALGRRLVVISTSGSHSPIVDVGTNTIEIVQ